MTRNEKQMIKDFCKDVKKVFKIGSITANTNLVDIISVLGGSITFTKKSGYQEIFKIADDRFHIILSENDFKDVIRWKILQEIGDLFVHMRYMVDDTFENLPLLKPHHNITPEDQAYANFFAGCFSMPEEEFKQMLGKSIVKKRVDTPVMAQYFGLPTSIVHWWGTELGYLEKDF